MSYVCVDDQKSKDIIAKLQKELNHLKAKNEDLEHDAKKGRLRVETLQKIEGQLRAKIKQNDNDFLIQHQTSCKLPSIITIHHCLP